MYRINLHEVISALSDALDLVGVDSFHHGKRVGFMAVQAVDRLPDSLSSLDLLHLGMLHDIGVSSTRIHQNLVEHFNWEGAGEHCRIGYERLKRFPPLEHLAEPILHHHTPWEELKKRTDLSPDSALFANWIFLTDRADVMAASHHNRDILQKKEPIIREIRKRSGTFFEPGLVELFSHMAEQEAFWLMQDPRHISVFVERFKTEAKESTLDFPMLKKLSLIFSEIVDSKSEFTHEHSLGVASLSRHMGELLGLSETVRDKLELAGLLHDLGKLQTPDEILDKPGPLTDREKAAINQHSFETYTVLGQITGMEEIAGWASYHHESPNGKGYPFRLPGDKLPLEARIIAVADVFQSLTQNRPYRQALSLQEAVEHMESLAEEESLDPELVKLVLKNPEESLRKARALEPEREYS